jgi:hypothetical protein
VFVWQGKSWQPTAQMPMDLHGIPMRIEWKGGAAIGTSGSKCTRRAVSIERIYKTGMTGTILRGTALTGKG